MRRYAMIEARELLIGYVRSNVTSLIELHAIINAKSTDKVNIIARPTLIQPHPRSPFP